MFFKKINNADLWNKIKTLRELIKEEKIFKRRSCWNCKKDLNIFDFLSDNLEYSAEEILNLWQNPILEFHCCECFKYLKIHELKAAEKIIKTRTCLNCNSSIDIYKFSKEYDGLKILELKKAWLDNSFSIFCSGFCEKHYYKVKLRTARESNS